MVEFLKWRACARAHLRCAYCRGWTWQAGWPAGRAAAEGCAGETLPRSDRRAAVRRLLRSAPPNGCRYKRPCPPVPAPCAVRRLVETLDRTPRARHAVVRRGFPENERAKDRAKT